ncbi:hypothetical protein AYL99_10012 [Fonsecaea erecta]|uniref:Heterokaryon incompatibility domain-containing protein n=1 Tax=Fonsecaea erecta TaxID=1367422 RepID=A0A178Z7U9_9EURO|nr:hypothetical protein AYL99_10012 [Fonsecaea erecta]OAP55860.1 hypothetical protein AYL99_10012 [Fonsecaea erecta]
MLLAYTFGTPGRHAELTVYNRPLTTLLVADPQGLNFHQRKQLPLDVHFTPNYGCGQQCLNQSASPSSGSSSFASRSVATRLSINIAAMHLLKIDSRGRISQPIEFVTDIPSYAVLSHTWGAEADEVTFADQQNGTGMNKAGHAKIQFCGARAREDGIQYFWVDTCCI